MTPTPKRPFSEPGEQEYDADVERWLRQRVVPVAAAMRADPGRAISAERTFGEIRELHGGHGVPQGAGE